MFIIDSLGLRISGSGYWLLFFILICIIICIGTSFIAGFYFSRKRDTRGKKEEKMEVNKLKERERGTP